MGLRFFKRRNDKTLIQPTIFRASFNGAALFQAQKCFFAPPPPQSSLAGFNGAALFQAQKLISDAAGLTSACNASMGLRFFKRRNKLRQQGFLFARFCFNGAALFQAQKFFKKP